MTIFYDAFDNRWLCVLTVAYIVYTIYLIYIYYCWYTALISNIVLSFNVWSTLSFNVWSTLLLRKNNTVWKLSVWHDAQVDIPYVIDVFATKKITRWENYSFDTVHNLDSDTNHGCWRCKGTGIYIWVALRVDIKSGTFTVLIFTRNRNERVRIPVISLTTLYGLISICRL